MFLRVMKSPLGSQNPNLILSANSCYASSYPRWNKLAQLFNIPIIIITSYKQFLK